MQIRIINLEEGMPTVKEAKQMLEIALKNAKNNKIKILKLIHGYGSSGNGGKIRIHILKLLSEKKTKNIIKDFITGDKWSIFNEPCRRAIDKCPELSKDPDLSKFNTGITIIILG